MQFGELSNKELVARITSICSDERKLVAKVVAYLIEVKRRHLHLIDGYSSLFDFCTRRLGMSNGAAFRRINAAKLAQRYPFLLPRLASGELHLSGLLLLRDHLTDANAEELAAAASGKSESEIEALIVARRPQPAVPERITPVSPQTALSNTGPAPPTSGQPPTRPSCAKPLSPTTYHLQLTMSADTHGKLLRARDMMRHRQPDGDLAAIVDRALDALLAQLDRQRLGKAERPRATSTATKGIPRGARRETFARDGQQCTYRSEDGNRCPARAFLELDHAATRSRGGSHQATNLRVYCQAHNQLHARQDFGDAHVDAKINARPAKSRRRGRTSVDGSATHDVTAPTSVGASVEAAAGHERPTPETRGPAGVDSRAHEVTTAPAPGPEVTTARELAVAAASAREMAAAPAPAPEVTTVPAPAPEMTAARELTVAPAPARDVTTVPAPAPEVTAAPTPAREVTAALARAGEATTARKVAAATDPAPEATTELAPAREAMVVDGLAGLGFAKADCVVTARAILRRSSPERSLAEVFREAIGVLAASPRRPGSRGSARPPA